MGNPRKPFGFIEGNKFEYKNDYKSVMQFVSKNKYISHELALFESSVEDQKKIGLLAKAIKAGDFHHGIFADEKVQLYSLYLLKHNYIKIESFTTVNLYITFLLQCTNMQELKEKDKRDYRPAEFDIITINNDALISAFSKKLKKFLQSDSTFVEEEFHKALMALQGDAGIIIRVKHHLSKNPKIDIFLTSLFALSKLSPLVIYDNTYFYIPSAQIIYLIINAINPEVSINMAPVFGKVSQPTLVDMHQKGFHPITLYSPFIFRNITSVHTAITGQVPIMLHDLCAHMYIANTLNNAGSRLVREYLIPHVAQAVGDDVNRQLGDLEKPFASLVDLNIRDTLRGSSFEKNTIMFVEKAIDAAKEGNKLEEFLALLHHDSKSILDNYAFDVFTIQRVKDYKPKESYDPKLFTKQEVKPDGGTSPHLAKPNPSAQTTTKK